MVIILNCFVRGTKSKPQIQLHTRAGTSILLQVYKFTSLFPHLRFTKVNNMRKQNKEHIILVKHGETV